MKKLALAVAIISSPVFAGDYMSVSTMNKVDHANIAPMIYNGDDANPVNYPEYARIIKDKHIHICGASILDDTRILTAAHCVDPVIIQTQQEFLSISLETVKDIDRTKLLEIKSIEMHADWDSDTLANDIAIITLKESLTDSASLYPTQGIRSINLPKESDKSFYNAVGDATIIGMGKISEVIMDPDTLQEASMYIEGDSFCQGLFGGDNSSHPYVKNEDALVCLTANSSNSNACPGDSGGPLFYEDNAGNLQQIGLASFIASTGAEKPICEADNYAFYTEILGYNDWIETKAGALSPVIINAEENPDSENSTPPTPPTKPKDPATPEEEFSEGKSSGGSTGFLGLVLLGFAGAVRKLKK